MNRYEELCEQAYDEQINIHQIDIPVPGMRAAYVRAQGKKCIVIKRDSTAVEQTCWLAEELGHHYTGTDRILKYDNPEDWRAESRARRWAHNRMLSPDVIRTAARNTDDIYEIADVLCVTVDFLIEAITDYTTKGLFCLCQAF